MVLLLEIARGIAALWVFFFHFKEHFINSSEFMYNIASYGYMGVPMFFVISGFVITYSAESTLKAGRSPLSFLKKRFLRIYPVFWISILVVLLLPYLIEAISMFKSGSFHPPDNLLFKYNLSEWLNFVLLTKVFFAQSSNLQTEFNLINSVYWTIAIEFQFYLIIFLSMYAKRYYKHAVTFISILAIINIFFPFNISYGLFIHYWPSFSVGILLAYIFKSGYDFSSLNSNYLKTTSLLLICLMISFITILTDDAYNNLAFSFIFGAILWCISPFEPLLVDVKGRNKSIAYYLLESAIALGAMSYSVYLLHGKLYMLPSMFVRQVFEPNTFAYNFATILFTLVICYPFYLFVERRFMSNNYLKMHKETLIADKKQC